MIIFENVSLSFARKAVFGGLSFVIKEGDKVVVSSRSGTGKSSLFSLILGFVSAECGKVLFADTLVNGASAWGVRQKVAFVDQGMSLGEGSAIDWLHSVFSFKANVDVGFSSEELKSLLDYYELGQEEILKDIEDLSGGERQRLAIIAAVLLKRNVFLLDEITSGLDAHLKKKTVDYFMRQKDWTVVVISHDAAWLNHPDVKVFDLKEKRWKQ